MPKQSRESDPKIKAAEDAIEQIRERFGAGSIMKLGDAKKMKVEVVPTGSISLDLALGIGGLPRGRIIEIFGPEMGGKSTLAMHTVAEVQKLGGLAAYVDAEHAMDPEYASHLGVKTADLLISQPDTGEQALEIVETLVRSNAVDVIVIDSVAALVPKAEIEGDMGDQRPGMQARLMSQALRKLTALISKSKAVVIFINQIRHKIGIMFGNPETTPGGMALKFYSSVRLEVRRAAQIKQAEKVIGNRVKVKVVKNKVAPPFRTCEFDIMYSEGISLAGDLLDTGVLYGVIVKSGNTFAFSGKSGSVSGGGEEKLGVGREAARQALKTNPKLMAAVRERIMEESAKREMLPVATMSAVGAETESEE